MTKRGRHRHIKSAKVSVPTKCIIGCHMTGIMLLIDDVWHCQQPKCGAVYPIRFWRIPQQSKKKHRRGYKALFVDRQYQEKVAS